MCCSVLLVEFFVYLRANEYARDWRRETEEARKKRGRGRLREILTTCIGIRLENIGCIGKVVVAYNTVSAVEGPMYE